ncbi:hypothetical protein MJG53_019065 [Ovis ammon polii x Ovis aries]|uniref:Uncharacterized protein n=1 Tax=Ovis ammon polii x Ovis aries TaxID=2918886 RepID=A0ACB9U229_9CETA|nr:hypothetical protein MJG53_019065 [Ovis ammon polii x Ovis aries]
MAGSAELQEPVKKENALLISFAALATFVSLCDAQCYVIPNESSASDGCKDLSGVTHQLRSDWETDNCESCHCDDDGIQCCSTVNVTLECDSISKVKPSEPFLSDTRVPLHSGQSIPVH